MFVKKFFLFAAAILFFSLNFSTASAEIKIIEAEGRYMADLDMNEPLSAITEHAREDARRRAAEKAAVFVESFVEVENNVVTKDKLRTYAATIMKIVESKDFSDTSVEGQFTAICKIKAEVDTSKINPAEILGSELQLQKVEEQNLRIQQLEEENKKLKAQFEKASSANKRSEIKNQFDKNQQQFLIAKLERDLDLFDLDSAVDWKKILPTAERLQELDPLNPSAFRATIYAYREQSDLKKSIDYCNKILNSNCPADTAIEACEQLGDIYFNEMNDKANAKKFIDRGINLVKKNYSAAMIEKLVNGTDFQISNFIPTGKTNTIRELYILKCDLENVLPNFTRVSIVEDMLLTEDRIHDIKYRTSW